MYRIKTYNKIADAGLQRFRDGLFEVDSEADDPDAILLRSRDLHEEKLPDSLKAVARAGAGVNNIPVERCTDRGIVVFNTPGANANSVKELVIASLFLSSRRIVEGALWVREAAGGGNIDEAVEKEKSIFKGPEIRGKKLGVIGLGAIGALVANDASSLGMEVIGYDPFISISSAWGLSRNVGRAGRLDELLSESDYITLHLPQNDQTAGFLDAKKFSFMKRGVRLLNFARGGLVDTDALTKALEDGTVERYVTDFPEDAFAQHPNVIPVPHLGASTPEAEENCAIMAADQLIDFLENGNIRNSVNFPSCEMPFAADIRLIVANRNIPNMVGQITTILAEDGINISDMLNRHLGDYAYNILDLEKPPGSEAKSKLSRIEGVVMMRVIEKDDE